MNVAVGRHSACVSAFICFTGHIIDGPTDSTTTAGSLVRSQKAFCCLSLRVSQASSSSSSSSYTFMFLSFLPSFTSSPFFLFSHLLVLISFFSLHFIHVSPSPFPYFLRFIVTPMPSSKSPFYLLFFRHPLYALRTFLHLPLDFIYLKLFLFLHSFLLVSLITYFNYLSFFLTPPFPFLPLPFPS